MRCVSESPQLLSSNTRLRDRDNLHFLDQSRLPPSIPTPGRITTFLSTSYVCPSPEAPSRAPPCSQGNCVEHCPHRDQRMILRYSHRVLLLSRPPPTFPHSSISCMGCEHSSGCCVILRSRFIDATHNFVPLCFILEDGTHQRHLYLILLQLSLWTSSRVSIFPSSLPCRCVFDLSCSRSYRMCVSLFCL